MLDRLQGLTEEKGEHRRRPSIAPKNEAGAPITGVSSQIQTKSRNPAINSRQSTRTGRSARNSVSNAISTSPFRNSANLRQTPSSGPVAEAPIRAQKRWSRQ